MKHAPHPFSLRQLQYVVAIAETLSFRKAAQRCRVSQPALSAQIAQLESALDVRLFERDRRGVLVTSAGEVLLERARRVLVEADDLRVAAGRLGDPLDGTLHVGVIPTISPYLLPDVAPALRGAFPRLTVVWHEDKTETLVRALADGGLDAALVALEADLEDLEVETVASDPFVLAMPAGHPLGETDAPVQPSDLRDVDVLLLDDGHCLRDQALSFCAGASAREMAFRATSLATLAQMVAGGAGVTLLPRLAVPTEAARAHLWIRAFAEPAPSRTLALAWRRTSPLTDALRRVAAVVRDACPTP